ncbi:hypothetical protein MMC22_003122 [Lobaria immixta]|nr:hypothetical protein [Lobaria immixta]
MGLLGSMYRQLSFKPSPIPRHINLEGQTAIVTGSNVGIGLEAARELTVHHVDRIILAVRNSSKGAEARENLLGTSPECKVEVWELDQESFESIIAFGERAKTLDRLDIVLLNAGVRRVDFVKSPTGHESTVQINHLGTALLSLLLLPQLSATAKAMSKPSRMTITSSEVHMWTPFAEHTAPNILKRMDEEETFGYDGRYNTSKLLNVLWARELASKIAKSNIIINMVNPGFCNSSLQRDDSGAAVRILTKIFAWTTAQGGHCLVDAAIVKQDDTHGGYLSEQKPASVSKFVLSAKGATAQSKVWTETIELLKSEAPNAKLGEF